MTILIFLSAVISRSGRSPMRVCANSRGERWGISEPIRMPTILRPRGPHPSTGSAARRAKSSRTHLNRSLRTALSRSCNVRSFQITCASLRNRVRASRHLTFFRYACTLVWLLRFSMHDGNVISNRRHDKCLIRRICFLIRMKVEYI